MYENPNPYQAPQTAPRRPPVQRDGWDWMILSGAIWLFLGSLSLLGLLSLWVL
jgi:hypothetical protein